MKDQVEMQVHGASNCVAKCDALGYEMHIAAVPIQLPSAIATPPLGPIIVQGMGGLKGVEVLTYKIPGNVPDGTDGCASMCGMELQITARIPNPAPMGLAVGTMNGQLKDHSGAVLGTVRVDNLALAPGDNTVSMTGIMKPDTGAMGAAAMFMSSYLQKKSQQTAVMGTDAGKSPIKWLQDVVNGIELSTTFPGASADFQALSEIELLSMEMTFSEGGPPMVGASVKARLNLPVECDMSIIKDVPKSGMSFDLVNGGSAVGSLSLPDDTNVKYSGGTITMNFDQTVMTVKDVGSFQGLVKDLLVGPSKAVQMKGTASPQASMNFGTLQLADIPFEGDTTMTGFNGFVDPKTGQSLMKIDKIDVSGGEAGILHMLVDFEVTNPSNVAPTMGQITLELWTTDGFKFGDVTVNDFRLNANAAKNAVTKFTSVPARYITPFDPQAAAAARKFISSFVSHQPQTATMRGTASGTSIPLLQPAMAAFHASSSVPGLADQICLKSKMYFPDLLHLNDLPIDLTVYNPFAAPLTVTGAACKLYACEKLGATSCESYFAEPVGLFTPDALDVAVPPKTQFTMPTHTVKLYNPLSIETLKTMFASGANGSWIRLSGTMSIKVGGFEMQMDLAEAGVKLCLVLPGHPCDNF